MSAMGRYTELREECWSANRRLPEMGLAEMALKTHHLNPVAPPLSSHLLDKHFKRKLGGEAYYGQPPAGKTI